MDRGVYTCGAQGIVQGIRVRIASYLTHYVFFVAMGSGVVRVLDFPRHEVGGFHG